jgi:hypothetical protein
MRVPLWWTITMVALAIASSVTVSRAGSGDIAVDVEVGTVAVGALALIWLPCLLRLLSLTGGTLKAGGVEATAGGLFDSEELVRRLTNIRVDTDELRLGKPEAVGVADSVEAEVNRIASEFLPPEETLTDVALATLAREYEQARGSMAPGDHRTGEMTRIVNEARVRARAAPEAARRRVPRLLRSDREGDRIVGLALAQEAPAAEALSDVLRLLAESSSAFQAYHALLALDRLVPLLSPAQKADAVKTLEREKDDPRGVGIMADTYIPGWIDHVLQQLKK